MSMAPPPPSKSCEMSHFRFTLDDPPPEGLQGKVGPLTGAPDREEPEGEEAQAVELGEERTPLLAVELGQGVGAAWVGDRRCANEGGAPDDRPGGRIRLMGGDARPSLRSGAFGVRRQVAAFQLADMSASRKAQTCLSTPKGLPSTSVHYGRPWRGG
jgi:hypothetical protein